MGMFSLMGTFSIWHWLVLLIVVVLPPIVSIPTLRKAGWNGWWCLLWYLPLVNVIFLWVFAFAKWPNEPKASAEVFD